MIVKTPRTFVSISTTSPTLMVVRDQGCGGQLERVRRYCVLVTSLPGPGLYWPSSSQTFSQGQGTTPWRDQHLHLRLNSQHIYHYHEPRDSLTAPGSFLMNHDMTILKWSVKNSQVLQKSLQIIMHIGCGLFPNHLTKNTSCMGMVPLISCHNKGRVKRSETWIIWFPEHYLY